MTNLTDPGLELDRAPFERVMNLMAKCHRAVILYLPNNPVYHEAVRNVQAGFREAWEELDEFILHVKEGGFEWEGELILEEEDKGDSISWVLFKEGPSRRQTRGGPRRDQRRRLLQKNHYQW